MSSFFSKLFGTVEHIVVTIGKAELKIAESSTLGQAIKAAVTAGEAGTSAEQKMELALASLLPTLKTYLNDPALLESDIKTVGEAMIESALPILKDAVTGPMAVIQKLEAMF